MFILSRETLIFFAQDLCNHKTITASSGVIFFLFLFFLKQTTAVWSLRKLACRKHSLLISVDFIAWFRVAMRLSVLETRNDTCRNFIDLSLDTIASLCFHFGVQQMGVDASWRPDNFSYTRVLIGANRKQRNTILKSWVELARSTTLIRGEVSSSWARPCM